MRKLRIVATIFVTALMASAAYGAPPATVAPQITVNTPQITVNPPQITVNPPQLKIITNINTAVPTQVIVGVNPQTQVNTVIGGGIIRARENAINVLTAKSKISHP